MNWVVWVVYKLPSTDKRKEDEGGTQTVPLNTFIRIFLQILVYDTEVFVEII